MSVVVFAVIEKVFIQRNMSILEEFEDNFVVCANPSGTSYTNPSYDIMRYSILCWDCNGVVLKDRNRIRNQKELILKVLQKYPEERI